MHENGDVALFLVLRRVVRWKFIGRSDQKLLEIGTSNLPPILNISQRLFIADPISHPIGTDIQSNAALAAIIDHPILWYLVKGLVTKARHQTFYKIWELKFKTSFQRRFCSAESAITTLAQGNALGPITTGTFALKGQNKNYATLVVVPFQGGESAPRALPWAMLFSGFSPRSAHNDRTRTGAAMIVQGGQFVAAGP